MTSAIGKTFSAVDVFWRNLRTFCYRNRTFLEVIFIFIYSIEQIILIYLTFKIDDPRQLSLIISIFAVLVLATFSFQRFILESKIRILEEDVKGLMYEKIEMETMHRDVVEKYNELVDAHNQMVSKGLNNLKSINNKKRG